MSTRAKEVEENKIFLIIKVLTCLYKIEDRDEDECREFMLNTKLYIFNDKFYLYLKII